MKNNKVITFILIAAGVALALRSCVGDLRRPNRYLIPQGYLGEIRVIYREKNAPPLPIENGYFLLKIPAGGTLKTSSVMQDGWGSDQYFYYKGTTRQQLDDSDSPKCMIQSGSSEPHGKNQTFFIGTRQQLRKAESWAFGNIPDGPLDPKTMKAMTKTKK